MDMSEGIIARFRTMAVARASVLTGHVIGSVIQTMLALAMVMVVAVLIGFRPTTGPVEWLAAVGILALAALAVTWLSVALGLVTNSVETASNLPMFLILLPFLSSGFVPTDSMPDGLSWFAENQPFTPVIETVRGLLLGTPIGNSGLLAVAWCVAISIAGYLWATPAVRARPGTLVPVFHLPGVIHDVVGGAAHEELDRPGPRRLALRVVGADGVEVVPRDVGRGRPA